jgi:hypothetical protein
VAEDSGTFKTNPAKSRQIPDSVMAPTSVARKPHLAAKAFAARQTASFCRFVTNAAMNVTVF